MDLGWGSQRCSVATESEEAHKKHLNSIKWAAAVPLLQVRQSLNLHEATEDRDHHIGLLCPAGGEERKPRTSASASYDNQAGNRLGCHDMCPCLTGDKDKDGMQVESQQGGHAPTRDSSWGRRRRWDSGLFFPFLTPPSSSLGKVGAQLLP